MFMARKLLDFKLLLSLYFTFIKNVSNQKKRQALGSIFNKHKFESIANVFQELKLLIFSKIYIFETLVLMLLFFSLYPYLRK